MPHMQRNINNKNQQDQLVQDIDALLEYHQIPACSICVVNKNDGIVWKQYFGDNDNTNPKQDDRSAGLVLVDTLQFHLFSGTKLYTGVAILQLAEQGKLQLTDPVVRYLPPEITERGALDDRITIEHCLGHVTGWKDTPMKAWLSVHSSDSKDSNNGSSPPPPTLLECLRRFDFRKSTAVPGTGPANYVNLNYVILGLIIERVSGQSYADYLQQAILEPLGSQACCSVRDATHLVPGTIGYWNSLVTYFLLPREQYDRVYRDSQRLPQSVRGAGLCTLEQPFDLDCTPIGGLVGTAPDFAPLLVQVLRAHSHDNNNNNQPPDDDDPSISRSNQSSSSTNNKDNNSSNYNPPTLLLSPTSWNKMVTKHFDGSIGFFSRNGVGLAFKIGVDFVNHEGSGPGFTSESRCYLDDGIGMVILMNKWSLAFKECAVCHEICELLRAAFTPAKTD